MNDKVMEFYESRPLYKAVQFDGSTESVGAMMDIADIKTYTITNTNFESTAILTVGDATHTLRRSDWLLRAPDGKLSVQNAREFHKNFERRQAADSGRFLVGEGVVSIGGVVSSVSSTFGGNLK